MDNFLFFHFIIFFDSSFIPTKVFIDFFRVCVAFLIFLFCHFHLVLGIGLVGAQEIKGTPFFKICVQTRQTTVFKCHLIQAAVLVNFSCYFANRCFIVSTQMAYIIITIIMLRWMEIGLIGRR